MLRAVHERDAGIEVVAVNDIVAPGTLAHLLRYDSVFGRFPTPVTLDDDGLVSPELEGRLHGYAVRVPVRRDRWSTSPSRPSGDNQVGGKRGVRAGR